MTKPVNKTIIIIVAVAVLGLAGGSGATYYLLKDKITPIKTSIDAGPPEFKDVQVSTSKVDSKLPEGTISPNTVGAEPYKYVGKQLKLRGLVVESSPGGYSAVGQGPNQPNGVKLDFSKSNIDPSKYANGSSKSKTPQKTADPVTISGKMIDVKIQDGNHIFTLLVDSVM